MPARCSSRCRRPDDEIVFTGSDELSKAFWPAKGRQWRAEIVAFQNLLCFLFVENGRVFFLFQVVFESFLPTPPAQAPLAENLFR